MRFAIFREAGPEAGDLPAPPSNAGVTLHEQARLAPPTEAMRVRFLSGGVHVAPGSFIRTSWPFTQLAIAEAASREAVLDWLNGVSAGVTSLEVRESGCAGGLPGIDPTAPPTAPRFAVFVRADADTEAEAERPPAPGRLAAMARANDEAVCGGRLLAGDGLRATTRATRVTMAAGRPVVRDGPFAEAKELVAGFWIVQAAGIEEVVDWVKTYPYAQDQPDVEIRPVLG